MAREPYATPAEYRLYCPEPAETPAGEDELLMWLDRASDEVDALCFGRIRRRGFAGLTAFQQEKIKKATCLHADFLRNNAGGPGGPLRGYSIGNVKMSFDAPSRETLGGVTTTCTVLAQLRQSGLALRRLP